jgi:hypothetical protein
VIDQVGHDIVEGEIQLEEIDGRFGLTPSPAQALEESHTRLLGIIERFMCEFRIATDN